MTALDAILSLARASVSGAVAAISVGLVLGLLRHRVPAHLRAWAWWLVAAQFLAALVPAWRISLPGPPPAPLEWAAVPARIAAERVTAAATPLLDPAATGAEFPIQAIAVAGLLLWALGASVITVRHLRAGRVLERRWRAASPSSLGRAEEALLREHRARTGSTPEVCLSGEVTVPLTLGGRRPRILLPASWTELDEEARLFALAHECAHVERRDLLFGWVPVAVVIGFWFHPLARWVAREYGQAREESCDRDALRRVPGSPRRYGELLLHFGIVPRTLPSTASCGSSTRRGLLRRLHMLDSSMVVSRLGGATGIALIAVASIGLLPLRLEAGRPGGRNVVKDGAAKKERIARPAHLEPERFAYLLVSADGKSTRGTSTRSDGRDARRAQRGSDQVIWWFRIDEQRYVLDDGALLDEVRTVNDEWDAEWKMRMLPFDERWKGLDRRVQRLDGDAERIDTELRQITRARDDIRRERDPEGADAQLDEISRKLEALRERRDAIFESREDLIRERDLLFREREDAYALMEERQLELDRDLYELARRAVERGLVKPQD